MTKFQLRSLIIILICSLTSISCKEEKKEVQKIITVAEVNEEVKIIPIDTTKFDTFFKKYPKFGEFESDIRKLYNKYDHHIWQDGKGLVEFAQILHNQTHQIHEEGISDSIPYDDVINSLFYEENQNKSDINTELLISSMYFYYTKKVYGGIDKETSTELGWYLPRENTSYVAHLDTLIANPNLIKEGKSKSFSQYYNLKKGLKKYRAIEQGGGWGASITFEKELKSLKIGDSAIAISQIRTRLFKEGYLENNSEENTYDDELITGINKYKKKHNKKEDGLISKSLIKELNIPVEDRIKTILVNMERCRWVTPKIDTAKEYIAVNIPSYRLHYFIDGEASLISRVVVGKKLNETVIFSGEMSYIAFSPYWNIPSSILENEIKPKVAKDENYLSKHNMEWVGNRVRQKPGGSNALGLVKFIFPNSNNIYLHDTPSKSLFNKEGRAFSHGCIRVESARELAIAITKRHGDDDWNAKKVDKAMHANKENIFNIKNKIPVYIAYFTAWADKDGNVAFFDDVYKHDDRLANLLYKTEK
ncbi:MAG: L,D-transpeptidase [Flavobacterium sp. MedPE-SWcel]|uniref:L,D-transpeptidase family protein n=1 Tax=uncultured Flavobacterium sp. TaxID=165435 RepID=UPI000921C2ED|nr:L,D-transpeptidase family protein [uncultured Flavobacterium sp.]OIQ22468.1 MAG: L,D-transpeptidase [Flavobacterium sp. MedPE-SWcel]